MKSILVRTQEFESKVGKKLEKGTNSVEVILTQKECPGFSNVTKICFNIDIIKAIDDEEYSLITGISKPEGRGIIKYENDVNVYRDKLLKSLAIDIDATAEKATDGELTKVVIGVNIKTEKTIYINLSNMTLQDELKIVKGKMDFYTRKEIVGIYASANWSTLYKDNYIKINNNIYRQLAKNKISELDNYYNEKNLLRIINQGLFEMVTTIEQIDILEKIKECSLYYKNNKLYQLNDDNNNLYDEFFSFYGDEFKCYKVLPEYKNIVDDLSNSEIKQFIAVEEKQNYGGIRRILDLELIYINELPYVIKKVIGDYFYGFEHKNVFYSNGYLYEVILPLSNFCFHLNSSISRSNCYGAKDNLDRYTNITLSLDEFIKKCEEEGYIVHCDDISVFNEIIPNLVGKKACLIKELTEKSTLVNIEGIIVEQHTNRMVVTIEYFGHFKEIVNISNLLTTEEVKLISYWDGCNKGKTNAMVNVITGEVINIEAIDIDDEHDILKGELFIEHVDGSIEQVISNNDNRYYIVSKSEKRFKEIELHGVKYIGVDEINEEDLYDIFGIAH